MEARSRFERAAAAILAVVGVSVVGWIAIAVVEQLPAIASDNPRQRDGALFGLIFLGIPVVVGGLLTLLVAWLLWRGHTRARALALVWIATAGLASWILTSSFGTVLWAVRTMVLHPDALSVRWPYLYYDPTYESPSPDGFPVVGRPIDQLPFASLDSVNFWVPGIVALGVLAVAGLLLATQFASSGQASHVQAERPS